MLSGMPLLVLTSLKTTYMFFKLPSFSLIFLNTTPFPPRSLMESNSEQGSRKLRIEHSYWSFSIIFTCHPLSPSLLGVSYPYGVLFWLVVNIVLSLVQISASVPEFIMNTSHTQIYVLIHIKTGHILF